MRPVHVLTHDPGPLVEARVDDDLVALPEAVDALAERHDDAGAVGSEDARLGRGGEAAAEPDVQVVEARRPQADQHLARPGDRIGRVLVPENLGPSVLVDPNGFHCAILAGGTLGPT